jgi:hypothetical protein
MIFVTLHGDTLFAGTSQRNLFVKSTKRFKPSVVVSQRQREEENDNDKSKIDNYLV